MDFSDRIWQILVTAFGAILSFFIYRQKTTDDELSKLDERLTKVELSQNSLETNITNLSDDIKEIKDTLKSDNKEFKDLLMSIARKK